MTAPTPDREWDLLLDNAERLGENNPDSWEFSAHEVNLVLSRLAAVTAERDQARQMLADAEKRIADMELDASLREEDERFADPL